MTAEATSLPRTAEMSTLARSRGPRPGENIFHGLTLLAVIALVGSLLGIIVLLAIQSWPALSHFGIGFIWGNTWNPVTEVFGARAPVLGTLITAGLAMLIGVPLAFGVIFFLSELCPYKLRTPLTVAIELLAAVPSIVYGIWGLFVLAPFMAAYVQPALADTLGEVPLIGALFDGAPLGNGMLTASLVLAVMILPYIVAVGRQVIANVPPMLREAAFGVGATRWEVFSRVLVPYASRGLLGGVMLGLGRALGETMAVTFVIGNAHHIAVSLFAPGTTISATLANEFTEATGDLYISSLLALGFILFVITFIVLAFARYMLSRGTQEVR